ncbi:PadR family transcriptional regulator [Amycolatopsis speibonae]|uniref:PadR family transcriptional regulator n=1 Tax=Amycolatopsis speibonae TaxID=1450224 RepID=A0ABV7NP50_9PSEU
MESSFPAMTPAIFVLLLALSDGPRHGYGLAQDVSEMTEDGMRIGAGTLYRSLQRMQVEGLVEQLDEEPDISDDGRADRRRSYRLTEAGHKAASTEARRLSQLVEAARRHGFLDDDTTHERKGA